MILAKIQFVEGLDEKSLPIVVLSRSKDGSTGTAVFRFHNPTIFSKATSTTKPITGMYLIDREGTLLTRNLQVNYVDGKPKKIEAIYVMKKRDGWDRFMRFMRRYSKVNELIFTKPDSDQF
uniref:photosystem II protein W n=1 Tax=Haramonas pauciplastida TaxID=478668 RepID=UPI002113A6DD|nr:photosystem II protein W [Haramonas pauciplastida]YP_010444173.1 photosystem II protein W [Haramonas pauciplastida]UTE95039.1 photosystem II protein W [Haramonas pauciplastida]UTE95059.1 photosystem II protein W [Haramonas pauciplastida]